MALPDADHVSRYCKPTTIENGMPLSIAFMLRENEDYLSVNWLECFRLPNLIDAVNSVSCVFRCNGYGVSKNGMFAVFNVGATKTIINKTTKNTLCIEHMPFDNDTSHSGIFGYTINEAYVAEELMIHLNRCDVHPIIDP